MVKVLLFRVGIDTCNQGRLPLAPIFEDDRFVFLPLIQKEEEDSGYENINKIEREFDINISDSIGKEATDSEYVCHFDPCFNFDGEYSYGDTTRKNPKAHNLMRLHYGDYLVFCNTMVRVKKSDYSKNKSYKEIYQIQEDSREKYGLSLYIFGFFKVIQKEIMNVCSPDSYVGFIEQEFKNNAHIRRSDCRDEDYLKNNLDQDCYKNIQNLIFIKGCPKESCLFKKAIKLGQIQKHLKKGNKKPTVTYKIEEKWQEHFDKKYISTRPYQFLKKPESFLRKLCI